MHRVEELMAFEPSFPVPKLRVKTVCGRFLVGMPVGGKADARKVVDCRACGAVPGEVVLFTVPWYSMWSHVSLEDGVLTLQDWRMGLASPASPKNSQE